MSSSDSSNPQETPPPSAHVPQADALAEHAESIRKLSKDMISDVIEIGRRLRECKQLLGHGNWLSWLEHEFAWSERTARNFISAYEFADRQLANVADLGINISSLYLLAAPSTPEAARAEVLGRIKAGEVLPYGEVKRIASVARAGTTREDRKSIKEMIRERYGDFLKLPADEQAKVLQKGPEHIDLAIADATTRQRWSPPYRELHDALEAVQTMAKRSPTKIINAIPLDDLSAIKERLARAKDLLTRLDSRLQRQIDASKRVVPSEAALSEMLRKARRSSILKYGRPTPAQILETIWPDLNTAQIEVLRNGKYGAAIKAAADKLM